MCGFFVIIFPEERSGQAGRLFARVLAGSSLGPPRVVRTPWALAAAFPRLDGSGGSPVSDDATGSWILAAGTWLHAEGLSAGGECELLGQALSQGCERLAGGLEGFFNIVIGNGTTREVTVITDLAGSRHCFAARIDGCTAISDSSLLLARLAGSGIDRTGLLEFLRTGAVYGGRTLFEGIGKLGAAAIHRFDASGGRGGRTYWDFASLDAGRLDGDDAVESFCGSLTSAARRIAALFPRPVCDLTGGYDSRAVVAAFLAAGARFETTVTGGPGDADVEIARRISQLTRVPHHFIETPVAGSVDELERSLELAGGDCDLVDYARVRSVHLTLSPRFDLSVNGSYGELARGYWWELVDGGRIDAGRVARERFLADPYRAGLFGEGQDLPPGHFAELVEGAGSIDGAAPEMRMDAIYIRLRMEHWQGRIASSTDRIRPCLSPFMLRPVLETALQAAPALRRRGLLVRRSLAALNPSLASVPLACGHPAMPVTIRNFPRFIPYAFHVAGRLSSRLTASAPAADLWRIEGVADYLDPSKMLLGEMMDRKRLAGFLDASRREGFDCRLQLDRMLSAELARRAQSRAP